MTTTNKKVKKHRNKTLDEIKANLDEIAERKSILKKRLHNNDQDRGGCLKGIRLLNQKQEKLIEAFNSLTGRTKLQSK